MAFQTCISFICRTQKEVFRKIAQCLLLLCWTPLTFNVWAKTFFAICFSALLKIVDLKQQE